MKGAELYSVVDSEGDRLHLHSERVRGAIQTSQVIPVEDAVPYFAQSIKSHPDDTFGCAARGVVLAGISGDFEAALADLNEAIRRQPRDAYASIQRGGVWITCLRGFGRHAFTIARAPAEVAVMDRGIVNKRIPGKIPTHCLPPSVPFRTRAQDPRGSISHATIPQSVRDQPLSWVRSARRDGFGLSPRLGSFRRRRLVWRFSFGGFTLWRAWVRFARAVGSVWCVRKSLGDPVR